LPICFALLLITLLIRNPVFRETIRYSIQGVALAPILYYFVQTPAGWAGRILNTQVLTFLGTVSYALYLLHATVLLEINQIIPSKVLAGVLSLFVAILLAYLVHIFVEKPTDAMRKKFRHTSDKMQQTQVEKSSAAVVVP
jgi:peptidoglycan/LPS O-acetylase OafA/YrhL